MKTKIKMIAEHFASGKNLTPWNASKIYGTERLAARVHELESRGMTIKRLDKFDPRGTRYREYWVAKEDLMDARKVARGIA